MIRLAFSHIILNRIHSNKTIQSANLRSILLKLSISFSSFLSICLLFATGLVPVLFFRSLWMIALSDYCILAHKFIGVFSRIFHFSLFYSCFPKFSNLLYLSIKILSFLSACSFFFFYLSLLRFQNYFINKFLL